jgi:hypothetical protein
VAGRIAESTGSLQAKICSVDIPLVLAGRCPRCDRITQIDRFHGPRTDYGWPKAHLYVRGVCGHLWRATEAQRAHVQVKIGARTDGAE